MNQEGEKIQRYRYRAECQLLPSNVITPRYNHSAVFYKNKIFVIGGAPIINQQISLFSYSLDDCLWVAVKTKGMTRDLESTWGQAAALLGNRWFLFGGVTEKGQCVNWMRRLNLEWLELRRVEQRGEVPRARQGAHMVSLERNWLILYGGRNRQNGELFSQFQFYNTESKNWYRCSSNYEYQMCARIDSSLCIHQGSLYLFGGLIQNEQSSQQYLDDFYQINPTTPYKSIGSRVFLRRILTSTTPEPRSGHKLLTCSDGYLALVGGQNSTKIISGLWLFNIKSDSWLCIPNSSDSLTQRKYFSCVDSRNGLYLFGGFRQNLIRTDFTLLRVPNELQRLQFPAAKGSCRMCFQQQRSMIIREEFMPASLLDEMIEQMTFPFAAFGLLADNCLSIGATFMNIHYQQEKSEKRRVIRIDDNGKISWTYAEWIDCIANFQTPVNYIQVGVDKKIKFLLHKENVRRQFGSNLKLGGLRLGSTLLYVTVVGNNNEEVRVCLIEKVKDHYMVRHCCFGSQDEGQNMRPTIQSEYKHYIQEALLRKYVKNTLYIFQSGESKRKEALVYLQENDLVLRPLAQIQELKQQGVRLLDVIDISLRCYLSALYLKNDIFKIYLGVCQNPTPMFPMPFLEKYDKLVRASTAVELDSLLDFQFRLAECYYLNLPAPVEFFSQGLLFYQKNRLITRYQYPFGDLLPHLHFCDTSLSHKLRLFGYAEIPDNVPLNVFKTDFVFQIMLEKLYSRLKFLDQYLQLKALSLVVNPKRSRPDLKKEQPKKPEEELKEVRDGSKRQIKQSREAREAKETKEVIEALKQKSKANRLIRKVVKPKITGQMDEEGQGPGKSRQRISVDRRNDFHSQELS